MSSSADAFLCLFLAAIGQSPIVVEGEVQLETQYHMSMETHVRVYSPFDFFSTFFRREDGWVLCLATFCSNRDLIINKKKII